MRRRLVIALLLVWLVFLPGQVGGPLRIGGSGTLFAAGAVDYALLRALIQNETVVALTSLGTNLPSRIKDLKTADLDGDGDADLAALTQVPDAAASLQVLQQLATGVFVTTTEIPLPPGAIAFDFVTLDGQRQFLVGSNDPIVGGLYVAPLGGFPQQISTTPVKDVDATLDGLLAVAVPETGDFFQWMDLTPTGLPVEITETPTVPDPEDVELDSFCEGCPRMVVLSRLGFAATYKYDRTVRVWSERGTLGLSGPPPNHVTWVDGGNLAIANGTTVYYYVRQELGEFETFPPPTLYPTDFVVTGITAGDFNTNGTQDVAVEHGANGSITIVFDIRTTPVLSTASCGTADVQFGFVDNLVDPDSLIVACEAPPNEAPVLGGLPANVIDDEGSPVDLPFVVTDTDSTMVTVTIDWGDGGMDTVPVMLTDGTGSATPSHPYADDGTYTINLTVEDDKGGTGDMVTLPVTIANVAPVLIALMDQTVAPGEAVMVEASFSDAGASDMHTATIDWGDGNTTPGSVSESDGSGTVAATHSYTDPGTFPVTLTVNDDGLFASDTFTVTVRSSADLEITKTDDPDPVFVGDVLTYTLTIINNGPDPASNVRMKEVGGEAFIVSADLPGGTCEQQSLTMLFCSLPTLAAGGRATLTVKVRPGQAATLTNHATVTSDTPDPEPGNNEAVQETTVRERQVAPTLGYVDPSNQATDAIQLFDPPIATALRIRATQTVILTLERLIARFGPIDGLVRARDAALVRIEGLVPMGARYTVGGPGTGNVAATLQSLNPDGSPIALYNVTLSPDGEGGVRSYPFVAIRARRAGRRLTPDQILGGSYGSLTFVEAQAGGSVVTGAAGYSNAVASVVED